MCVPTNAQCPINKRTLSPHLHQPVKVSLPLQFRPRTACPPRPSSHVRQLIHFHLLLPSPPQAFPSPHCSDHMFSFLFSLCIHVQQSHKKPSSTMSFGRRRRHISMSFPGVRQFQCCRLRLLGRLHTHLCRLPDPLRRLQTQLRRLRCQHNTFHATSLPKSSLSFPTFFIFSLTRASRDNAFFVLSSSSQTLLLSEPNNSFSRWHSCRSQILLKFNDLIPVSCETSRDKFPSLIFGTFSLSQLPLL